MPMSDNLERARAHLRDAIGLPCSDSTKLHGLTFGGIAGIIAAALSAAEVRGMERAAQIAEFDLIRPSDDARRIAAAIRARGTP